MANVNNLRKSAFEYAKRYSLLACIPAQAMLNEEDNEGNKVTKL